MVPETILQGGEGGMRVLVNSKWAAAMAVHHCLVTSTKVLKPRLYLGAVSEPFFQEGEGRTRVLEGGRGAVALIVQSHIRLRQSF